MKRSLFFALALLMASGVSLESFGQATPAVPVRGPGLHIENLRMEVGVLRYVISVPTDYSSSKPVPLILALHYGGSSNGAAQGLMLNLVQPALAAVGALIIAPESMGGAWSAANNERAVNTLVDAVLASYAIDTKRMAVTGFSMGGSGTWSVVAKNPERFSAAVPVAGMPPASMGAWKTPVFAVHSRDDEVMPIGPTEARIKELQKSGVRADLVVLSGISHHQTNRFVDGLRRAVPWLTQIWQ
ncbi:MAG TPA: prolyl oligopeptidase family serine peptidase [Terriglobia bacterium]|nr:prolyl oligopeptidase family serine peptidase [Terriglobia bacterium]